jgi:hypothetical protein
MTGRHKPLSSGLACECSPFTLCPGSSQNSRTTSSASHCGGGHPRGRPGATQGAQGWTKRPGKTRCRLRAVPGLDARWRRTPVESCTQSVCNRLEACVPARTLGLSDPSAPSARFQRRKRTVGQRNRTFQGHVSMPPSGFEARTRAVSNRAIPRCGHSERLLHGANHADTSRAARQPGGGPQRGQVRPCRCTLTGECSV